ncbi:MAG: hypothetical protein A2017_17385 [Lentisphaerae bacterium GWF2_44_16]|nr:MAG: hypothetical protein A2017_17385 [Lentisphaerae bacterium GWF2_44_16]
MFSFRTLYFVSIMFLIGPALCLAEKNSNEKTAVAMTEKWLALTDSGKYDESWSEASAYFKNMVSNEQWKRSLEPARKPLGKTISRRLKSALHKTSLPGVPDGEYFVIQFDTSFENKKTAVETVTSMLDKDGKFRVSGYYIK